MLSRLCAVLVLLLDLLSGIAQTRESLTESEAPGIAIIRKALKQGYFNPVASTDLTCRQVFDDLRAGNFSFVKPVLEAEEYDPALFAPYGGKCRGKIDWTFVLSRCSDEVEADSNRQELEAHCDYYAGVTGYRLYHLRHPAYTSDLLMGRATAGKDLWVIYSEGLSLGNLALWRELSPDERKAGATPDNGIWAHLSGCELEKDQTYTTHITRVLPESKNISAIINYNKKDYYLGLDKSLIIVFSFGKFGSHYPYCIFQRKDYDP
jgi:hypothetical protein